MGIELRSSAGGPRHGRSSGRDVAASTRSRPRRKWLLLAVVPILAALGVPLAAADEQQALKYVALGDSSAAGPGISPEIDTPCHRSERNWPHFLASALGADLTDVTCSSATTADLEGMQGGTIPPQFKALGSGPSLVTLAIGANDIALYRAFQSCANLSPSGPNCRQLATVNGVDQFDLAIAAIAPKVRTALETIHDKVPAATVVVVGYLTYWRQGGCFPSDPYRPADADYIQEKFDRLMSMLSTQAKGLATYADIRGPSADHGLCEQPGRRWLEGLPQQGVPAEAEAYHPNATGMENAARIIAGVVRGAM